MAPASGSLRGRRRLRLLEPGVVDICVVDLDDGASVLRADLRVLRLRHGGV